MNIVVEQPMVTVETEGDVTHVAVQLEADLKVSPERAQDLIMRLVTRQIGPCVRAESPELLVGERWLWRVPVVLSLPEYDDVGIVDWFHVDAQTTQFDLRPGRVEELARRVQALANTAPSEVVPPEFKVAVPAAVARRSVTAWLVSNVGNLLIGGEPHLVESDPALARRTWRVPIIMAPEGREIEVATIDVDAESGDMTADYELAEQIREKARALGSPAALPTE